MRIGTQQQHMVFQLPYLKTAVTADYLLSTLNYTTKQNREHIQVTIMLKTIYTTIYTDIPYLFGYKTGVSPL